MDARSGRDRRKNSTGLPPGQTDRRRGADRRTLTVTQETLAEIEAKLAEITPEKEKSDSDESGWDKVIIPIK
ncbi:MAG: hypothetical protein JNL84_11375 [Candidatus Accumulibacter sp.]|nr:hypothetical protein [Accumulibacter sp.]